MGKENWYVLYDFNVWTGDYIVRVTNCDGPPEREFGVVDELRGNISRDELPVGSSMVHVLEKIARGHAMMAEYIHGLNHTVNWSGLLSGDYEWPGPHGAVRQGGE